MSYDETFIPIATKIFKEIDENIDIRVWNPNNIEDIKKSKIKVVIARGGTAKNIRESLDIPVVEIDIPFKDIADALIKAKSLGESIGVVGYDNIISGLSILDPLITLRVQQVYAQDEASMKKVIKKLKKDKIEVIVGGVAQSKIAKELGMSYVLINLNRESLKNAYLEASVILENIFKSLKRKKELNMILDYSQLGYIAVNLSGKITFMNQEARDLIKYKIIKDFLSIHEIFPEFKIVENVLMGEFEVFQELMTLKGVDICYSIRQLKVEGEIRGAIITFENVLTIKKAEKKIRKNILRKGLKAKYNFDSIYCHSEEMKNLIEISKKFSRTDSTILINGETGVGKEVFAQSIHNNSKRKYGPFVAVNCASLPESILESELFGYEKGAFTGAKQEGKEGLFELAHKGTIFLDEISELPLRLQGRFLRIIQEREVMRLGSNKLMPIDVRIIAATNRSMDSLIKGGLFREDLYYRINVLSFIIPPLRERKGDIKSLSYEFFYSYEINKDRALSESAIDILSQYNWPGNIRQLKNFIEKLTIISEKQIIDEMELNRIIEKYEPKIQIEKDDFYERNITKEKVLEALKMHKNKNKVAEHLNIHRTTLWRLLKKYDI